MAVNALPGATRARALGLGTVLLAATTFFLLWMNQFTPLRHWLVFRYGMYWALALGLWGSCALFGNAALDRLLRGRLPLGERAVLATATGLLAFGLVWFVIGICRLYSTWTFALVPLAFAAAGAPATLRLVQRYARHRALFRRLRRPAPWFAAPLVVLGVLALALLYLAILTPQNVAYDSRWYHLAVAERYVVQGGIRPFEEGWFVGGAYPQLATWLYSWAFLLPPRALFDQIELAAHLEFVGLLFTLVSIPVLVRRVLGPGRYGLAWVARFAFPGVFVYDAGPSCGADHIAAVWAVPTFLAFLAAFDALELRACLLLAVCLSGALLTKYSALGMAVFPVLAVTARAVVLAHRRRRSGAPGTLAPLGALASLAGAVLVLTAPHWLKNWVWYGDPVYPLGYKWFHSPYWTVDSPDRFGHFMPVEWSAPHTWQGVWATLRTTLTFSFVPNDWPAFHGNVPVFGSLLTLSLPCLLFLRPRARLFALVAATQIAIAVWYWMFHQDRYLQAYLPWMAAIVACIAIEIWRAGVLPRLALVALVAAQLAWGGDAPFIPAHVMAGGSPFHAALDLLSSSYRKAWKTRLEVFAPLDEIKARVGPDATVLLHEEHLHLGIGVSTVSDWIGWQGAVSYGRAPRPSQMYRLLRRLGVTHLAWTRTSRAYDSMGGDLAFYNFVTRYAGPLGTVGGFTLSKMPDAAPDDSAFRDEVLYLGCGATYANGLYRLSAMTTTVLATPRSKADFPAPSRIVTPADDLTPLLGRVDAVVHAASCFPIPAPLTRYGLERVAVREGQDIWIRSARAAP